MSSRAIADLCEEMQPKAQAFLDQCRTSGIHAFLTCTYRSGDEQNADYACGRTQLGHIITNARAGQSAHNCTEDGKPASRAFDFGIMGPDGKCDWDASDPQWKKAIAIGQGLGLVSGSTWHSIKDNPHFELPTINSETL